VEQVEYKALNPDGKAVIKAAHYQPAHELPDEEHPFFLSTGRTIYQFHTRTKTGRAPQLQAAAPEVWAELSEGDADRLDAHEGDLLEITTPRGSVRARLRVSGIRDGVVFLPFHYGYWDADSQDSERHDRAANELTITDWDPASKQPIFKTAAAAVRVVASADSSASPAPTTGGSAPSGGAADSVPPTTGGARAQVEEVGT
jgi:predicted molibdopterin-dependent oxidoreductase YjgC